MSTVILIKQDFAQDYLYHKKLLLNYQGKAMKIKIIYNLKLRKVKDRHLALQLKIYIKKV